MNHFLFFLNSSIKIILQVIVDMDSYGNAANSGRKTSNGELDNKRVLDEDTNNNNNRNKSKRDKNDGKD